MTSVHRFIR